MAQEFRCGTPLPTERQRAEIIKKLRLSGSRNSSNCEDAPFDSSIKTYRLVFEYVAGILNYPKFTTITQAINAEFNPIGIYFDYFYFPVDCDNCYFYDYGDWGRENPLNNTNDFRDCLWGRIVQFPLFLGDSRIEGQGDWGTGRFWATYSEENTSSSANNVLIHELGHALGLHHTFNAFGFYGPTLNEYVEQISDSPCGCNCKYTGDYICDTPVDPYGVSGQWVTEMFVDLEMPNLGNKSDYCGTSYTKLTQTGTNIDPKKDPLTVLDNYMSYHGVLTNRDLFFSAGQVGYIKDYNNGKPWEVNGPTTGGEMNAGFTVNQPMLITSPLNLTGNIEIRSKLTVKNTSILFMNGGKIVIKPGGELILDNGHLGLFKGMGCIDAASSWEGITAMGPGVIKLTARNGSTINDANIALYSKDATLIASFLTGSKINSYFTYALQVTGGKGRIQAFSSYVNGLIFVNNFFPGVIDISGTNINTPRSNNPKAPFTGILIENASLTIRNQSIVSANLTITNMGTQTVNLRNSDFYDQIKLFGSLGVNVVRDNVFYYRYNANLDGDFLSVTNVGKIDVVGNTIRAQKGVSFQGYVGSAPLIFKNNFIEGKIDFNDPSDSYFYKNDQDASQASLLCNYFSSFVNAQISLLKPINLSQGNPDLVAGNSFKPGTGFNILYLDQPNINYYYNMDNSNENLASISGPVFKFPIRANSACNNKYPNTDPTPNHCKNNIKDGNETGIDCGGSCPRCIEIVPEPEARCTNGVKDGNETAIDCGGSCPTCVSCTDGILNNGETTIDCGGPCPPCGLPTSCSDGIMNGNETGIDCGGPSCAPCTGDPAPHCYDGIQNANETGVDCGGSCPACIPIIGVPNSCYNGIKDGNETGIDCGGACPPCVPVVNIPYHCYNGVQDGNETGVDCGGSCPSCTIITPYPPSCYNGKKDGNETGIDCGGSCVPCGVTPPNGGEPGSYYTKGDHSAYLSYLNGVYGTDNNRWTNITNVRSAYQAHRMTLDGGQSCDLQQFITDNSASQPTRVLEKLIALSPNVSSNAIHTLFANSTHYTSGQITNLLILNPTVLTDRYISYLLYQTNTFSALQKSNILTASRQINSRKLKEDELALQKHYMDAIIRDNIGMITLNYPIDFNAMRAELATDADPTVIFEIAQSYADEGRADLALETMASVDMCYMTDPLYRAQLLGMTQIYSTALSGANATVGNKSIIQNKIELRGLLNVEHGLATDMAISLAQAAESDIPFANQRWAYAPLMFKNVSGVENTFIPTVEVYPNPATDILNVIVKDTGKSGKYEINITDGLGSILSSTQMHGSSIGIDIASLMSGIYTVKVSDEELTVLITKFIKIK